MNDIVERLDRIEELLNMLLKCLIEEQEEDGPDGDEFGVNRDDTQVL
jgi:hypothetical protein